MKRRKSKTQVNEGILSPLTGVLIINCSRDDLLIEQEPDGRISVLVQNFTGGIEIVHPSDRTWWPV